MANEYRGKKRERNNTGKSAQKPFGKQFNKGGSKNKFEDKKSNRGEQTRKKVVSHEPLTLEDQGDRDLVAGRVPVLEVLKSDRDINKVFIQDGLGGGKIQDIITQSKERGVQVQMVPKSKLDTLVEGVNHQGVVVAVAAYQYSSIDELFQAAEAKGEDPFFIILDGVEDPHNLGSIMRTADASGVHGIIIPKRRAVGLTATVAKASTGAIEHVPVARVTNLSQTIKELKERGVWIYATDMKGTDYRKWTTTLPIGLVIGNEGKGVSRLVKEQADEMLTIPMTGHVQSLNASVAASLLMYEVYRGRHS